MYAHTRTSAPTPSLSKLRPQIILVQFHDTEIRNQSNYPGGSLDTPILIQKPVCVGFRIGFPM